VGGEVNASGEASPIQSNGSIIILQSISNLVLSGATIKSEGGANTATGGAPGGNGGTILFVQESNAPMILAGSTVSSAGGMSRTGKGGVAGVIALITYGGAVEIDASSVLNATGGHNMGGLSQGGDSTDIYILTGPPAPVPIPFPSPSRGNVNFYGTLTAEGGDGCDQAGGKGGTVSICCADLAIGNASGKPVLFTGGGSSTIAGGWGNDGGDAGNIAIDASGTVTVSEGAGLIAIGGAGDTNGDVNHYDAEGGEVTVRTRQAGAHITIDGVVASQGGYGRDPVSATNYTGRGKAIQILSAENLTVGAGKGFINSQGGYPALLNPTTASGQVDGGQGGSITLSSANSAAVGVLTMAGWVLSNGGGGYHDDAGNAGNIYLYGESKSPTDRTTISGKVYAWGGPLIHSTSPKYIASGGKIAIEMKDSGTVTGDDLLISGEVYAKSSDGSTNDIAGSISVAVAEGEDDIEISGTLKCHGGGSSIQVNPSSHDSDIALTGTAVIDSKASTVHIYSQGNIHIQDNALCKVSGMAAAPDTLLIQGSGSGRIDIDGDLQADENDIQILQGADGTIDIGSTANLTMTNADGKKLTINGSGPGSADVIVAGTLHAGKGSIDIDNARDGTISITGSLTITPDDGDADTINIYATGGSTAVITMSGAALLADSTTGGGGQIKLRTHNGGTTESITVAGGSISCNGGNGGKGGEITFEGSFSGDGAKSLSISTSSNLTANGGASASGIGGAGGIINIAGDTPTTSNISLSGGTLEARGGASTGTSSQGIPLEGGQGGSVTIQAFATATNDRAIDVSGGNCEGGHAGLGGTFTVSNGQKFTNTAGVTLNGGTSTFASGGGGTGGKMEVIIVSGTTSPNGITISGTVTADGGAGNAYGGDGGTVYLDATQSDTTIVLTNSTFNVRGGSGGISGQAGSAGSVTAYTDGGGAISGTPTVDPSSAYIKRP
jgi:hypothetical protein